MKKQGFTLVELLVVITIIGMLMSLLIPAVQSAREAGRRNTCLNNQKNLTLAAQNYEAGRGAFPGYVNRVANNQLSGDGSTINIAGSWVMVLLPYLDRNELWQIWSDGTPVPDRGTTADAVAGFVTLKLLLCPSDPPVTSGKGTTHLSYRVNCGYRDNSLGAYDPSPASGVFHSQYRVNSGKFASGTRVSLDYINSHDGTTTTLMMSEAKFEDSSSTGFAMPSSWVLPNGIPGVCDFSLSSSTTGGIDGSETIAEKSLGLTMPCLTETSSGRSDPGYNPNAPVNLINKALGAPSSYHPGIVVASFCDGHATTLSEEMNQTVYMHLMTPYGSRAYDEARAKNWSSSWFYSFNPDLGTVGVLDESEIQ